MGKRSILTLVLLGTVLQGESLSNRILVLEGMKRTVNESGELSIDYILAGRHAKAAEQARLLFPVKREWGQLFNEAFCRSILKDPVADRAWRDFSMLDRKEKPAKRWLDLAKAAQEAHVRGSFSDEKAWIEEIRQIYQGRGYYTAAMMIDLYVALGSDPSQKLFLREIRADLLLRAGWPEDSILAYRQLYREKGDEFYLYQQAKGHLKINEATAAWGLLMSVQNPDRRDFNYYVLLLTAASQLKMTADRVRPLVDSARRTATGERESRVVDSFVF